MTRIGLDLRFWRSGTGGIGRYSRNLLSELLKLDHLTEYTAIITPEDEPEFTLQAENLRKVVVDIPHFSPAEQLKLPKILRQGHYDLVHFANFNHPILYRGRFVVTIHDMIMHMFPGQFRQGSRVRELGYNLTFNDCKRARKIIVPSTSTKNDLVQKLGFPERKVVITPEGSETKFRPHSAAEIAAVKKKLNLPDRYLLFVSRWEKYKGLLVLLQAFERLTQEFPELGLVICGKPDKQNPEVSEAVEQAKQKSPRVITPGFVSDEDLVCLYSGAAAYVHPSWYEGFGIMILEAFGAGAPVVTSNVSSLPEVVGDAGLLVDPYNVDELVSAIKVMLTDSAKVEEFRRLGFEQAKRFSWQKMAEQTLAIYQEVLKNDSR